ncbi:MAG: N-acetylneuraminate synthase family protein [Elusimicrobia bacterium]|nr:N-acetylneuraminate synthase family protein [Elusimicrobiota bacterium]
MKGFSVEGKEIGLGKPCFVIAELGYNFVDEAEMLAAVDAAAQAGCDSIKLQTFRADTVVAKGFDFPAEAGGSEQWAEFKRYEISEDLHRSFFRRARDKGIVPLSTPSHPDDLALLERVGSTIYKVGSDDLTNLPFLSLVASTGKPLIFSSGMAALEEVEAALKVVRAAGNDKVVLLQCTSNYPIKDPALVNARVIETYREKLGVLSGYSDHTTSLVTPAVVAALGARVYERHFTLSKDNGTPDAPFSADPAEMKAIVAAIRAAEAMLGDGVKKPTPTESRMRAYTRKGAIASRDLAAGETLAAGDFAVKRPALGIAPADAAKAVGRRLKTALKRDQPLTWEHLE